MSQDSDVGARMYALISELYPVCRSITGDGIRQTLRRVGQEIPVELTEIPSGTQILDWVVPDEWNIRDAFVADSRGRRVIDFRQHNLHVVNYSVPVDRRMSLSELRPHLHALPDRPEWIPYRTTYYKREWGFCLSQRAFDALRDDEYHVVIDSTLQPGALVYGECFVPGQRDDEVLISCHTCHPSLANDNLSSLAVAVELARSAARSKPEYSYRFLFIPGTVGSIAWLAGNRSSVGRVRAGLVLSCLGDSGGPSYKRSRRGDTQVDRAAAHVLRFAGPNSSVLDWIPYGYDERQYCSPGFDLPVGCLSRSRHGTFPEYHTSGDNLTFVRPEALLESLRLCTDILEVLEHDRTYLNRSPYGEPQLGRRGLYQGLGGASQLPGYEMALLWVLSLSDGRNTLLGIAERSGARFSVVLQAARALERAGLLEPASESGGRALETGRNA